MTDTSSLYDRYAALKRRHEIEADIVFTTSWRIGSGREGETGIDLGVLIGPDGQPLLPGSSLKGKLRSLCETLAGHLGMKACQLQSQISGVPCVSDTQYYRSKRTEYESKIGKGVDKQMAWIEENTCDVCKLFGSPLRASRIRISDGVPVEGTTAVYGRDGVVLDRDSRTAVPGLKYDYEVVGPGARFHVIIRIDNASDRELALVGAALIQMADGESLGGFVSRGLGRFRLENVGLWEADLGDAKALVKFLTSDSRETRMNKIDDWVGFFGSKIQSVLTSGT